MNQMLYEPRGKQQQQTKQKGTKMKCKVKGLVFVGFAAAILAGAAHAAGENIVTSKAYTDATYQAKTAANNAGKVLKMDSNTAGDIGYTDVTSTYTAGTFGGNTTGGNLVTESAVAAAIAAAGAGENDSFELTSHKLDGTTGNTIGATTSSNDTTMYPSAAAVKEYVGAQLTAQNLLDDGEYQPQTTNNYQLGSANGTWSSLDSVIDNTTASSASAPTTAAVKTYVDSQATSAASSILTGTQDANDTSHALTNAATTTALAGKQDNLGGGNDAGKVVTATSTAGDVAYTAIDTAVTSGSSNLVTSDAVYDALHGDGTTDLGYERVENKANTITTGEGGNVDSTNYPTTNAVVNYVDSAINTNNTATAYSSGSTNMIAVDSANHTISAVTGTVATGQTGLVSGGQVADAIAAQHTSDNAAYQAKSTALSVGNGDGGWTAAASSVTNDANTVPTTAAVYNAIQAQPASKIPDQNTNVCTSTQPCALVAGATNFHWITMATGNHPGGVCGDAGTNQACEGLGTAPTNG